MKGRMRHRILSTHPIVCCPSRTYPRVACFLLLSSAMICDGENVFKLEFCWAAILADNKPVDSFEIGVVKKLCCPADRMQKLGLVRESDKSASSEIRKTRIDVSLGVKWTRNMAQYIFRADQSPN